MREEAAATAAAAEEAGAQGEHEEEESEEEESEYETESSEEDELAPRLLLKPVFVPKSERATITERELREQREEERLAAEERRIDERKAETREILAHAAAVEEQQEAVAKEGPRGMDDVNTDDEEDEEAAYEAWAARELQRLADDREAREREAREAAEKARWRAMTEEERARELALQPRVETEKPKKKWGFLQKYWHKGAFFQSPGDANPEDAPVLGDLASRDFSAPTGEDRVDRATLPKIMQKRNFGKRSQTKWTHLVDQDTTNWDSSWGQSDATRRHNKKMAASGDVFTAPKSSRT